MSIDVLAIVGSRDLTEAQRWQAVSIIEAVLQRSTPDAVVTGDASGIDELAAMLAERAGITVDAKEPRGERRWAGPGGFQERNLEIVAACTRLICLRSPQSRTYGSGWTADEAERQGKPVRRITLVPDAA